MAAKTCKNGAAWVYFWYVSIAGLCCIMVGLGFARFAYTPMIPALIHGKWLTLPQASYLGTINFIGYFVGAYLAHKASQLLQAPRLLNLSLILAFLSLIACAWDLGFDWLAIWRFLAGVVGAFLVVITPSNMFKLLDKKDHTKSSGIMFAGTGLGIVLSSFVAPLFAKIDLWSMWMSIAALTLIATLIARPVINKIKIEKTKASHITKLSKDKRAIYLLGFAYILCGIGIVPHAVFLADYMHRNLGASITISGILYSLFGAGCIVGALIGSYFGKKIGIYKALVLSYTIGAIAVIIVLITHSIFLISFSAFLIGVFLLNTVNLTSLRTGEIVGTKRHAPYWGRLTLCFAIGQALGLYVMSFMLSRHLQYIDCFDLAAITLVIGLASIALARRDNNVKTESSQ